MFKFIHIADVHLDTQFYSRSSQLRNKLRESLRLGFQQVIYTCIEEQVDALLIAGDLFDTHQLSFQTEQFLMKEFLRLKEHQIQVFYSTGNHDPGRAEGRIQVIQWPDNVTIFRDEEIQTHLVLNSRQQPVGQVVGVGHKHQREARNLVLNFPHKAGDLPWVGLVHTLVTNGQGVEAHDRYLPCTKEDLEARAYDYWALGHVHQFQKVSPAQEIYYSGNLQGRSPRETGEKGGLLVSLQAGKLPIVKFLPFSTIRWETLVVKSLDEIQHYQQLRTRLEEEILAFMKSNQLNGDQLLLRVELQGRCPLKEVLSLQEEREQLEEDLLYHFGLMAVEVKAEELKSNLTVEAYLQGNHVLQKTLERLTALESDQQQLDTYLQLSFAKQGFKSPEEKRAYLRSLLTGLQEEAVERMAGDSHAD